MPDETPVLIAGAGPTGLAAALFLRARGIAARIVDPKPEPSKTSNALGVNPRTLELLEPTGVSARILAEALPLRRLVVHQDGRKLGAVELDPEHDVGARFPMVILPQWRTEALLTEALAAQGIAPERGLKLTTLTQDDGGVSYTLASEHGGEEPGRAAVLFAADGAHSTVRHALGLAFPGSAFPETWKVIDVEVDQPGEPQGYVDFRTDGPFIALPYSRTHWRIIGPGADLEHRLPPGWTLQRVQWSSDFHMAHRIASQLNVGRVCLAGDAAHIHAPIGARGMNLGIEDAWVFAECCADFLQGQAGRLADYGRVRHEADAAVVHRIERLAKAARARGPLAEAIRPFAVPLVRLFPPLQHVMERTATGLDHEVRTS